MSHLAEALEYKYGCVADTKSGKEITAWRHTTIPKPTQAEIDACINEYLLIKEERKLKSNLARCESSVMKDVLFDLENRIRKLEGKPPIAKESHLDHLVTVCNKIKDE